MFRRTPWRPASRRAPSASWSPMSNLWLSALALLVLFILDGLLAMARAAPGNSRGGQLPSMVAGVAARLPTPFGGLLLWLWGRISGGQNGRRHPLVTEEEIMPMVDAGEEGGAIEQDAKDMIYSIFH